MLKEDKFEIRNGALFLKGALYWDLRKDSAYINKIIDITKISLSKSRNTRKSRNNYYSLKK